MRGVKKGVFVFKNIVVSVNPSKISEAVFKEAINLAKDQHAKLTIVHVADMSYVNMGGMWPDLSAYHDAVKKGSMELLTKMEGIAAQSNITAVSQLVEMQDPDSRIAELIVSTADKLKADLLVVGTHGRTGLPRFLLGSVAEEIIRTTTIPVLLMRGSEE